MSEKTRYTDEELEEFKTLILQKLEKAKKEYESYAADVMNSDGNDTSDTSPTFKVLEEGGFNSLKRGGRPYGNAPGSVYKAFTRCISTH